jgi:membrane-associated protease RseP (regulator of RpoE activity)
MSGNGHGQLPVEVLDSRFPPLPQMPRVSPPRPPSIWPALLLFLLTVLTTLSVGSEFALSYAQNREPFSGNQDPFAMMLVPFEHPHLLVLGVPFSFTLLVILMAHEMGHFVACRIYGIDATYPYFIPAPTLFGTFGAFIRIRSPITTRRALFDVGISGPIVGFLIAAPAMAYAVAFSKIVPGVQNGADILFADPPLVRMLNVFFHPHVNAAWVLLNPIGRAAWMGMFATALNLLPVWQLDGGHILFSLAPDKHQQASLAVSLSLVALGIYTWHQWQGWLIWGFVLTILCLRYRHPPLYDPGETLDLRRRLLAIVAVVIFVLCFTPWPVIVP